MVADILAYSQVDKELKREELNLNEILAEVKENLTSMIEETRAKITADTLPKLFAGKTAMLQVFQNLISNSIKFTAKDRSPEINIFYKEIDEKTHQLIFEDNGIGIKEENQKRVFEMFNKFNSSDLYPGSGIGLALVARIIKSHAGEIQVESKENVGTRFIISLEC